MTSRVRLADFGEDALRRNLEDLAWVERTARAHDAVLARALTPGAVVPLRLCTIFTDADRGARARARRGGDHATRSCAAAALRDAGGDGGAPATVLDERRAGLHVVVTGPWPPYNFATEEHE